ILSMARLVRGKGVDVMIGALADLPNSYHCTIAGDGPERRRLEALASSLGVMERVTFTGWVSGDSKYHLLESADIFCLPSTRDSFGIVYIEAMAYGLPIVAVRSRGIPDVVLDGRTGYLVDTPDPLQVAEAVQKLADPKTREQMGSAGKLRVMEEFSSGILAGILRRVIDGLN
ncbi:MAG: glycosyltransferase, partial [Anaerolineales bacterium]